MKERNTIQKRLILKAVNVCDHPTADDVYNEVAKTHPSISRGTVYRNLGNMSENGDVLRIEIPNAPDRFDRTTEDHYHFRCLSCGRVSDVDAQYTSELFDIGINNFHVLGYDLVFKGLCNDCFSNSELIY